MSKTDDNIVLGNVTIHSSTNGIITAPRGNIGKDLSVGTTLTVGGTITWSGGTSARANSAYTHISSTGTDHTYINQSVVTTASPTFNSPTLTGSASGRLTLNRTGSAVNSTVEIKHTGGSIYLGHADTGFFGISTSADISSGKFKVEASTGNIISSGYIEATNIKLGGTTGAGSYGSVNIESNGPTKGIQIGSGGSTFRIYRSTNNVTAHITRAGVDTMGISMDAVGKVGLGIVAPTQQLHVSGNTLISGRTMVGNASTYFDMVATNTIHTPNDIKIDKDLYINTNSGNIYLGASAYGIISRGGDSIVRIGNGSAVNNLTIPNGYLSVATSSTSAKLNVGGTADISGLLSMPFRGTAGTDRNYIELQAVAANNSANERGAASIAFRTSTSANYFASIGGQRIGAGLSALVFKTGGSNPSTTMYLDEKGNLGLGDTITTSKLDILEGNNDSAVLRVRRGVQDSNISMAKGFGNPYIGVGGSEYLVGSYHTLGFGYHRPDSYPYYPVELGSVTTTISGSTSADFIIATRSGTSAVAATERLRVTSAGKVGIGTSSPDEELEVVGNIRLSDSLTDGSAFLTVANARSAYDHISSNGSSHSYINQSVITTASPSFKAVKTTDGVEVKNWVIEEDTETGSLNFNFG